MTPLYYECHVTIDPVFDERLEQFKELCKLYQFHVAKLLMQKGGPSNLDSFCTGRGQDYKTLENDMYGLITDLIADGFRVRRYKIEAALLDSKYRL